jgi:hypothetical protein
MPEFTQCGTKLTLRMTAAFVLFRNKNLKRQHISAAAILELKNSIRPIFYDVYRLYQTDPAQRQEVGDQLVVEQVMALER